MVADLFDYPNHPGFKDLDASLDAAIEMAPLVTGLRKHVLEQLVVYDLTADEIASNLDQSVLTIRPRVSELRAMGLIEKTGDRRDNRSGKRAAVWRIKT